MNIHEHQAKAVLAEFGALVPRRAAAFSVEEEAVDAGEEQPEPFSVVSL